MEDPDICTAWYSLTSWRIVEFDFERASRYRLCWSYLKYWLHIRLFSLWYQEGRASFYFSSLAYVYKNNITVMLFFTSYLKAAYRFCGIDTWAKEVHIGILISWSALWLKTLNLSHSFHQQCKLQVPLWNQWLISPG